MWKVFNAVSARGDSDKGTYGTTSGGRARIWHYCCADENTGIRSEYVLYVEYVAGGLYRLLCVCEKLSGSFVITEINCGCS